MGAQPFAFAGLSGINGTSGASHASEIEFVFMHTAESEPETPQILIGDDEKLLAETIASYWINFARTSNPNPSPSSGARTKLTIDWEPFTGGREASIHLDLPVLTMIVGKNNAQCDFIDTLGVLNTTGVS